MPFSQIVGHQSTISHLQEIIRHDRIPSAYLFVGIEGIGKSLMARMLAQELNCKTFNSCGECPSCLLFEQGKHPDFIVLKPEGHFIKIAQIHKLIEQLSLKPSYAKKRVVLVQNVHQFNRESANAFLKTLEEPPLDTLVILTAFDEDRLIETILSRCQRIPFSPLGREDLKKVLLKNFQFPQERLDFILHFSSGGIRKDFLSKVEVLFQLREQAWGILTQLETEKMVEHCTAMDGLIKKDLHFYFLEFTLSLLHDLALLKLEQSPHFLWNADFFSPLQNQGNHFTSEQLEWAYQLTQETEYALKRFAGKVLALEGLLIQLKQVFAGRIVV